MRPLNLVRWRATAAALIVPCALLCAADARAGGMLVSNRDAGLAINAWGGAREGTPLRLHNGCREDNADCLWSYRGGLLISDRDPALAIKAIGNGNGAMLVLARGCQRNQQGCGWTYRDGMFVSDADNALAINAWGGARYGTSLRLSNTCRSSNPDCTWTRPR